jgi:hypothetical protein
MRDDHILPRGNQSPGLTKQQLTPAQQQLLDLCQRIRFGRIHSIKVSRGQPVVEAGLAWTRTVKVLGTNAPHPARQAPNFALKHSVVDLFRLLHELGDGEIRDLEVRDGLPCGFAVEETLTA